jgi:hypothetical protein
MAAHLSGPEHAKKAEDLLWQAGREKDPAEKANLLAEGQLHVGLAIVNALVHGTMSAKGAEWWKNRAGLRQQ